MELRACKVRLARRAIAVLMAAKFRKDRRAQV
jgi:hypothetical protein